MKKTISTLSLLLVFAPAMAFAKPAIMQAFKAAYPTTKLAVSCKVCHDGTPPKLNTYGLDLQKANLKFADIEQLDSDGDGVKNIDEINAASYPGDKNSVPAAQ